MIIEFEMELVELLQQEKSWNEICSTINQPMSTIAVTLKSLKDAGKVSELVKNNNVYYKEMTINEKILHLLSKSDLFAYELQEALKITHSDLWDSLKQLKKEGKIRQYFRVTFPSMTICFCLSENRKQSLSVRWGKGIKPWTPAAKPVRD